MKSDQCDRKIGLTRRTFLTGAAAGASLAVSGSTVTEAQPESNVPRDICVFSKHLQWMDFDEMAETAAEIGFDGVDIPVRPRGHVLPENAVDELPRAVEASKKAGLSVPMITTAINGTDSPHAEAILKTAKQAGVSHYRMGYLNYDDKKGIVGSLDEHKPKIAELAAMNREIGIHGGYQNHSGAYLGAVIWDIWYLVRDLDPRWIGCQYDIRHATVEGGLSWPVDLKLIAKFAKTQVVKDFKWGRVDGKWQVINTPIDEGMVDFKRYYDLVKSLKISGPISMHFEYPHEHNRETVVPLMKKDLLALRAHINEAGLL